MGQNISIHRVKRHRANSLSYQNRDKVNVDISNDIWLEALKFLTCSQWSQKRYVCRQMNGIIESNISYLPKMAFACADMYYSPKDCAMEFEKQPLNKNTVIAFDNVMHANQSTQWFEKRGFPSNTLVNIPADVLFIATEPKWTTPLKSNLNICIHGSAQETIPYSDRYEENRFRSFRKPVLFYAQFNPVSNQYSWNYIVQFLKFIYHPMTYIKEVKMFAVNQTFIDSIKCNIGSIDNESRYIRCESFSLERFHYSYGHSVRFFAKKKVIQEEVKNLKVLQKCRWELDKNNRAFDFSNLLKWLTRNVRTETLTILMECDSIWFDSLTDFLLEPSGAKKCASSKVKIEVVNPVMFLSVLIKKFLTSPLVEGAVPTIEFLWISSDDECKDLGPNLIDQEVDSLGAHALYMVFNEKNQMKISLCKSTHPIYGNCKIKIYSI